jgi:O-antigen ligase
MIQFPKQMLRLIVILLIIFTVLGVTVLARQVAWATVRMNDKGTVDDRIVVNDAMIQMIQLRPVFGWGFDNLDSHAFQFFRRVGDASLTGYLTSHNTYLTIITELGLMGFLFYIFPVVWWAVFTVRVLPRLPQDGLWSRTLLGVFWAALLGYIMPSLAIDMRFNPIGPTLFWMNVGMIANIVYPYTRTGDLEPLFSERQA